MTFRPGLARTKRRKLGKMLRPFGITENSWKAEFAVGMMFTKRLYRNALNAVLCVNWHNRARIPYVEAPLRILFQIVKQGRLM